ncbi:MAG: YtxH domain-containing protein [Clostridiaceae bacterium]|nr:YtxH domain-containing protein [Clostridiaceae bacterium]
MKIRDMFEKKMKERQKKQKAKMARRVTVGAVVGIVTGVVGGVLLAPKAGKETRDDIAKTARGLSQNAIAKSLEVKETLGNKVVKTKINTTIAREKISEYLSDKKGNGKISKRRDEIFKEEKAEVEELDQTKE